MDTGIFIIGGLKAIFGYLILLFVPGFVISLVLFPRFTDIGLVERLAYSMVLSIGSVIAAVLFMDVFLGVDTTPQNISLGLGLFSAILLVVWLCEIWYLMSNLSERVHRKFSGRFLGLRKYISRLMNSRRDRFTPTAMARVLCHESMQAGRDHVDHRYLIDIGEAIDIHHVDENKWKVSATTVVPPSCQKTQYFELDIREFKEEDTSLVDDLQIYPVHVTRKPDVTFLGGRIKRGPFTITKIIYGETESADVQWIYSHDFHLFAILHSEDTLGQMVDRVLLKLDEIATSIQKGSRVSSHMEDTQKLKDEFETALEKPRSIPTVPKMPAPHRQPAGAAHRAENDRRTLQATIVRDLKTTHIIPETFRASDRKILDITIPEKAGVNKILDSIKDLKDEDWLYE